MRHLLPNLFEGVRVQWFLDSTYSGRGRVTAVYSDGTIDVESDRGPKFEGWAFAMVRREEQCR